MKKSIEITPEFIASIKQQNENGFPQRKLDRENDITRRMVQLMCQGKFDMETHRRFYG